MASATIRLYNRWGERIRRYPLSYRLRGAWFARHFASAGWLAFGPGLPWPRVRNLGGSWSRGAACSTPGFASRWVAERASPSATALSQQERGDRRLEGGHDR